MKALALIVTNSEKRRVLINDVMKRKQFEKMAPSKAPALYKKLLSFSHSLFLVKHEEKGIRCKWLSVNVERC